MSAKVTNFYRDERKTKGTARLILMMLAERANEQGTCFPSIKTIANDCMKSERTIQTTLKNMENEGIIGRALNSGKVTSTGKTNLYFLNDYRISVGLEPLVTKFPLLSVKKLHPMQV